MFTAQSMADFKIPQLYRCQYSLFAYCSHSFYSTRLHIARGRYRIHFVRETDDTAVRRESGDCSRFENGKKPGHFDTEAEQVSRTKRAGSVEGEAPTEEAVPKVCLLFVKTGLPMIK